MDKTAPEAPDFFWVVRWGSDGLERFRGVVPCGGSAVWADYDSITGCPRMRTACQRSPEESCWPFGVALYSRDEGHRACTDRAKNNSFVLFVVETQNTPLTGSGACVRCLWLSYKPGWDDINRQIAPTRCVTKQNYRFGQLHQVQHLCRSANTAYRGPKSAGRYAIPVLRNCMKSQNHNANFWYYETECSHQSYPW